MIPVYHNKKYTNHSSFPKLHSEKQLNFLFKIKNIILKSVNENLVDIAWSKKPKDLVKPFFPLADKDAGESSYKKILRLKHPI